MSAFARGRKGQRTMSDGRQYLATETLKNGLEVTIRAARPDDLDRVLAAFRELDAESVYLRFFGQLSQSEIAERVGISQVHVSRLLRLSMTNLRGLLDDRDDLEAIGQTGR